MTTQDTQTGADPQRCPCGLGSAYSVCCGALHRGERSAATAEQLMRSRYSAFALGLSAYLLETWHPNTRPEAIEIDPDLVWRHLSVESSDGGGPFDSAGTVRFTAVFRDHEGRGQLREHSRFVREGRWYYVDGDLLATAPGR